MFEGPYEWTTDGTDCFTVAPDGERFMMLRSPEEAANQHEHVRIVLNWFDDLRRTFAQSGGKR